LGDEQKNAIDIEQNRVRIDAVVAKYEMYVALSKIPTSVPIAVGCNAAIATAAAPVPDREICHRVSVNRCRMLTMKANATPEWQARIVERRQSIGGGLSTRGAC